MNAGASTWRRIGPRTFRTPEGRFIQLCSAAPPAGEYGDNTESAEAQHSDSSFSRDFTAAQLRSELSRLLLSHSRPRLEELRVELTAANLAEQLASDAHDARPPLTAIGEFSREELARLIAAVVAEYLRDFGYEQGAESETKRMESSSLRVLNVRELLALKLPPRELVLDPILREQDTLMLYAWRGVGKTMLALQAAYAIATGSKCLHWKAPTARRVLYVDSELSLSTLQERLALIIAAQEVEPPVVEYLRFLAHDAQESGLPDLATRAGQAELRLYLGDADVIFLDSLSTLVRGAKENDAESWQIVQDFLLSLRHAGKTTFLVHHAGKGGAQRGTSKREDILDTVIQLRHPTDYRPEQGARFEVHFEKCRALAGEAVAGFEAWLAAGPRGATVWTMRDLDNVASTRAKAMFDIGMSVRDVAEELGISKSAAHRLKSEVSQVSRPPTSGQRDTYEQ